MDALETLKISYLNELPVNRLFLKVYRRQRNVFLASLLTRIYGEYSLAELNRSLSESSQTYKEAEDAASLFEAIFNMDIKPADMLISEEDSCNKAIDHYNQMSTFLKVAEMFSLDRESIMAFCKSVEYGDKITWLKVQANLNYKYHADNLLLYMLGYMDEEQFKELFVEYSLFTKKASPVNMKHLIRTKDGIIALFDLICKKRELRNKNK